MTSFRRLSVAATVATFLLVAIGGLVRATESGLGCGDDWPQCGGRLVPSMARAATAIEYSHRLAAATVVVLIAAMVVLALRHLRSRRIFVWTSIAAFGLVLAQAVLGAVVVKLDLQAVSVVLHLATAMALVALLIAITALAYGAEDRLPRAVDAGMAKAAAFAAGAVLLQLLVGSYVSGKEAGLVYTDWPLMNGKVIPAMPTDAFAVQFTHRVVAVVAAIALGVVAVYIIRRRAQFPAAAKLAHAAIGLYALEIVIGAANIWTRLNSAVVTAHLTVGALIFGCVAGIVALTSPGLRRTAASGASAQPASTPVLEGRARA